MQTKAHSEPIQRFRRHHGSSHLVRKLEMLKPWKPVQLKHHLRVKATARTKTSWFSVGYHPRLCKQMQSALNRFLKDKAWSDLYEMNFGSALDIRVPWRKQSSKFDEQST